MRCPRPGAPRQLGLAGWPWGRQSWFDSAPPLTSRPAILDKSPVRVPSGKQKPRLVSQQRAFNNTGSGRAEETNSVGNPGPAQREAACPGTHLSLVEGFTWGVTFPCLLGVSVVETPRRQRREVQPQKLTTCWDLSAAPRGGRGRLRCADGGGAWHEQRVVTAPSEVLRPQAPYN